jgi:hypothetical protein
LPLRQPDTVAGAIVDLVAQLRSRVP